MLYANQTHERKKIRVPTLVKMKGTSKISAITCYDACFAKIIEKSGIHLVLVGDSLGHVIQGNSSTIGVTVNDICYHTKCSAMGLKTPLIVSDMPFGSAGFSDEVCFSSAQKLMSAGAEAVKIEGATPEICRQIKHLVSHGIPVVGHIGLIPQSVHTIGGYKIQGKQKFDEEKLILEALHLENAGCFSIVLELVSANVARKISSQIKIPTIGIGSGAGCDGQILVLQDMLGMNQEFKPKFLKHFANLESIVLGALESYSQEVNAGTFPSEHEGA
jgi:3-methyl-2-oxobutanoate hydroxymethyltransferase